MQHLNGIGNELVLKSGTPRLDGPVPIKKALTVAARAFEEISCLKLLHDYHLFGVNEFTIYKK